ncbi:MAG: penicillin-binding protein 2, partial [Erythrobacter sp.]
MKIPFLGEWPGSSKPKMVSASILRSSFERRAVVIGAFQGTIGVMLAARLGYLSVAENEKYRLESESNRVNLTLIPPRRGWILDRHGAPLASNRADFRVDVIPERLEDAQGTLDRLGELLALEPSRLAEVKDKVAAARGFQPVEVASGLKYEQFAALSVRMPEFPGVVPQRGFSRLYPTG